MAGPNAPYSGLDADQVLKQAFDATTDRLRVDAEVTATISVLEVDISAADGDNIAISDGVSNATLTTIGADVGLDVNVIGGNVEVSAVDLDIRNLNPMQDVVSIGDGVNALEINPDGSLNANLAPGTQVQITDGIDVLAINVDGSLNTKDAGLPISLGQKLASGSTSVVLASDQPNLSIVADPIKGTSNGLPGGTQYTFVNNLRQQILAAHDRNQDITYADFGTKNQRITQIDYTSVTFSGITARKVLSYTLVGTRYRRDSIDWTILP